MKKIKALIIKVLKTLLSIFKEKEIIAITKPIPKQDLLQNKIVLITGGNSGIGLAIAKSFSECGAKIILAGRNKEKLEDCCKNIKNSKYIELDVSDYKQIKSKIEEAILLFNEHRIDILVNSAGLVSKNDFLSTTEEEFQQVINTNIKGVYFVSQCVAHNMIQNKIKGHILNISSSSALRPAWTPYEISKWAIKGFTMGLADVLLPYGIIVNAIAPGPTATPMLGESEGSSNIFNSINPSKRYAKPEEIAALAIHMVSGAGDFIVGDTFYITGGSGTISMHC